MISLNVPNVITIGLISLLFLAAAKWGMNKAGIGVSWL